MITTLTLTNFRNHKSTRIKTQGAKHIILFGANGSGKTNIIEAISLLSAGAGLRRAEMTDLPAFESDAGFGIHAELECGNTAATAAGAGDARRAVKINGRDSSLAELLKIIKPIWLTPREDGLFYGAAENRRAFFDHLIAGFSPSHAGRLGRLSKLISERAAALRAEAEPGWLSAIEENLMQTAAAVAAERVKYCAELNHFFNAESEFGRNAITVSGWLEDRILAGEPISKIETDYAEYLADNRILMSDRQIFDGPQKSDFKVLGMDLNRPAHLCSTGQQKMILLSLALSHAKLLSALFGVSPVILLDEVAAHLDNDTRAKLLAEFGKTNSQIWMTGVSASAFASLPEAVFIEIEDGGVKE
ncbi:MAG: DNA replication and repair protein RecF [Rickettsiales bacterium]|jgi:DNA replication and repair protein RecF|nr:DNA replication and repair protein RecF [Rickettsiales bacterium]